MDVAIHWAQFSISVAVALNYKLCSTFIVEEEKIYILLELKFNAQLRCPPVLHKSQLFNAVTLLHDLEFD